MNRSIYTSFDGANKLFMRPFLRPPWTNSSKILCVRVFHHVLLKYGHKNTEMQLVSNDKDDTLYCRMENNSAFSYYMIYNL